MKKEEIRDILDKRIKRRGDNRFNLIGTYDELIESLTEPKQSEEVGNLQADIRNKLSPIDNLLEMLQDVFEITKFNPSEILIQEIAQCKISIEYLSNLTTQRVTEPKQSEEVKYSKEEDDFYIETEEGDYYLEPQQVLDRLNLTTKRVTDEEIEERCELLRFSKVLNGNSAEEIFIMGAKWLRDKQ